MATVFWDVTGVLLVDYPERGHTMTGSYYADRTRQLHEKNIKETFTSCGKLSLSVLFHQDNAPAHKSTVAMAANQLVEHPPYSPDIAPSDYYPSAKMKVEFGGHHFRR